MVARGVALAKSGSFELALAEFTASLGLFRTRNALINSALCLRDLGRFVDARRTLQGMLVEFKDSVPPEERAVAERLIATFDTRIGQVHVESVPMGATVIIDGQQTGVTPLAEAPSVDAGVHSIRVSKDGFAAVEASVSIEGARSSSLRVVLQALRESGVLRVREAAGRSLNVLVDGAVVGKTPFEGAVAPGGHSVALQGEGTLGTAPSSVQIQVNQAATLTLQAEELDSEVRIEPSPTSASVILDGVDVGRGVWQGRVSSGPHRVELVADDHQPLRREIVTRKGRREVLKIVLERRLDFPVEALSAARLYAELVGGFAWSPGFRGDADGSCDEQVTNLAGDSVAACRGRSGPAGFLAGARGGYLITPNVGVELMLGYVWLKQDVQRRLVAQHDVTPSELYSDDYRDTTVAAMPLAALSFAYQFRLPTLVTLRAWVGAGLMTLYGSNEGTFQSSASGAEPVPATELSIPERNRNVWVPLLGPELRVGYSLSKSWSLDAGLAALFFIVGDTPRAARPSFSNLTQGENERSAPIPSGQGGSGNLGVLTLPSERAASSFFVLAPSVAARFQFR